MSPTPRCIIAAACVGALGLAGCSSKLPEGSTEFRVGATVVRTDSLLDAAGVVFSLSDTSLVPPRGPVRHWLEALQPMLDDSVFVAARAIGAAPISTILEAWGSPQRPDTVCGYVAPGTRICVTGNAPVRNRVARFIAAARGSTERLASVSLDRMSTAERLQDLSDVYTALTSGKALDSAIIAWSGYTDLTFDITLARTLAAGGTVSLVDPARPRGVGATIFLPPDPVFPVRSYRSPNYVWLVLTHQMSHSIVARLFEQRPELLARGFHLRDATEPEMGRQGYSGIFWDETLGEQLARAVTLRVLRATSPTATWAARADALTQGMTLVPWLEDALEYYDAHRDSFPTLSDFAPRLGAALDSLPTDTCRGAPGPGTLLVGVERHKAVVAWMADDALFRAARLVVGDTVLAIDGDSVSGNDLMLPTRQLNVKWAQRLPAEMGMLSIRRGGRVYGITAPLDWSPRAAVRVASQARSAVRVEADSLPPACRWITRAVRR